MAQTYDIAVLGATPAGFAAALHAAKDKLSVVVVETPHHHVESPLCDWVPRDFFSANKLPRTLAAQALAEPFRNVVFHNAPLTRTVEHKSRAAAGFFLPAGAVAAALRKQATAAGVKMRSSSTAPTIRLEEDGVQLMGTTQIRSRLLIVAQDRPNEVINELGLPVRTVPHSTLMVAGLDLPATSKRSISQLSQTLHVVETPERSEVGMFFAVGGVVHLRIVSHSAAAGTRANELSQLLSGLQAKGLLPSDLPLYRAKGAVWYPPAGVALDMETHVAKRCILAGTAGGFAESITGQTLAPSVRSGILAAEAAAVALGSENVQESLMVYKTSWRRSLAEYLRPPNTSLQMLLPLLFVNERIVSKFTRALLYGESI